MEGEDSEGDGEEPEEVVGEVMFSGEKLYLWDEGIFVGAEE